jgi:hypothetical protein
VDHANTKRGVLRTALLCLWLLATGAYTFIWCDSHMQFWRARDSVIAEHATVVREPYWADALTHTINPDVENAGWTIDMRVADHPAVMPVALADFDRQGRYLVADKPPPEDKFRVGTVLPIWFLADARRFAPASTASPLDLPVVLFNRAIWPRSTSFMAALHRAWGEPSLGLYLMLWAMIAISCLSLFGLIDDAPDWSRATRLKIGLYCGLPIAVVMAIGYSTARGPTDADYQADTFTVVSAPAYTDRLAERSSVRVVERHWTVAGRLQKTSSALLTVPLEQIDPRRAPWASQFMPDLAQFHPGAVIEVWVDPALRAVPATQPSHADSADGALSPAPWSVVSRERWPNQRSFTDYVLRSERALGGVVSLLLLLGVILIPLRRRRKALLHG